MYVDFYKILLTYFLYPCSTFVIVNFKLLVIFMTVKYYYIMALILFFLMSNDAENVSYAY